MTSLTISVSFLPRLDAAGVPAGLQPGDVLGDLVEAEDVQALEAGRAGHCGDKRPRVVGAAAQDVADQAVLLAQVAKRLADADLERELREPGHLQRSGNARPQRERDAALAGLREPVTNDRGVETHLADHVGGQLLLALQGGPELVALDAG